MIAFDRHFLNLADFFGLDYFTISDAVGMGIPKKYIYDLYKRQFLDQTDWRKGNPLASYTDKLANYYRINGKGVLYLSKLPDARKYSIMKEYIKMKLEED